MCKIYQFYQPLKLMKILPLSFRTVSISAEIFDATLDRSTDIPL